MCRQSNAVSSPLNNNSGGRRRTDSAGQHNRLSDQSFHGGGVGLIDGHSSEGQTEETGGDTRIEGRKERGGKEGRMFRRKFENKEREEGRKKMKQSLYAVLLVL